MFTLLAVLQLAPFALASVLVCGGPPEQPCPDQWFLLIDGQRIVTKEVPVAPPPVGITFGPALGLPKSA